MPAAPAAPRVTPGSRFTWLLYVIALALGLIVLGVRLVRGLRTGDVEWLEMSLPAAAILMLTGIIVGPRRPWLYYPLLVVGFALLVSFYVFPHRVRGAPAQRGAPQPTVSAPTRPAPGAGRLALAAPRRAR